MISMRTGRLSDLPGAYAVCLATGRSGQDASAHLRIHDLLGHNYVGPYFACPAAITLVLVDHEGVAGYCLAVPDSRVFEAWREEEWLPELRGQFPPGTGHGLAAELVRLLHAPETAPSDLVGAYPAHLHVDLLPRAQGQGWGRRLLQEATGRLATLGVHGLHLGVATDNHRAQAFYDHVGLTELRRTAGSVHYGSSLP